MNPNTVSCRCLASENDTFLHFYNFEFFIPVKTTGSNILSFIFGFHTIAVKKDHRVDISPTLNPTPRKKKKIAVEKREHAIDCEDRVHGLEFK